MSVRAWVYHLTTRDRKTGDVTTEEGKIYGLPYNEAASTLRHGIESGREFMEVRLMPDHNNPRNLPVVTRVTQDVAKAPKHKASTFDNKEFFTKVAVKRSKVRKLKEQGGKIHVYA